MSDSEAKSKQQLPPRPKQALLAKAQAILSASEEDLPALLERAGGAIGDVLSRGGDSVQKAEALVALGQVGVSPAAFASAERAVLDAELAEGGGARVGTPSATTKTPAKKKAPVKSASPGSGAGGDEPVYTKAQFQQIVVVGLRLSLPRLEADAAEERKPPTLVSEANVGRLRALPSPWQQIDLLAELLGETDHRADVRSGIVVDYFAHHLFKCLETPGVDDLRTAIFLTVMRRVLDDAIAAQWPSPQHSFSDFRAAFVRFCDVDDDLAYEPFTVEQARVLTHHVSATFFRFFSSFKFVFTRPRDREEVEDEVTAEEPLAARPLREATQTE
jgi:hypothetical protein